MAPTKRLIAEPFTSPCTAHGEGPVWDPALASLLCVDLFAGEVLRVDPVTAQVCRRTVGRIAGCVRPRARGGVVVAVEQGFALLDADGTPHALPPVWRDPAVRMNDGACDPAGNFWCGSMDRDGARGRGALYRLDPAGGVRTILTDVGISNGLAFSRDGASAYYVDSLTQRVDVLRLDPETGEVQGREPFVTIAPNEGIPDGIAVDAEGGLWVALYQGSAVRRYLADGTLDVVVEIAARLVTACAFGGPELDELYVTTSREGLGDRAEAQAGAVFRVSPGVRGRVEPVFAG